MKSHYISDLFDQGTVHEVVRLMYDRGATLVKLNDITTIDSDAYVTKCRANLSIILTKSGGFADLKSNPQSNYIVEKVEDNLNKLQEGLAVDYDLRRTDEGRIVVDYVNR